MSDDSAQSEEACDGAGRNGLSHDVYQQLRAIAHGRMAREHPGHTLQTTALVHEALLRMTQLGRIYACDRPQFFRAAAESMRRILIDHARANTASKRGGGRRQRAAVDVMELADAEDSQEILALDEAMSRFEAIAPQAAEVVQLRFYAGLSIEETAEALAASPRSVNRIWTYARAWLWRELKSEK